MKTPGVVVGPLKQCGDGNTGQLFRSWDQANVWVEPGSFEILIWNAKHRNVFFSLAMSALRLMALIHRDEFESAAHIDFFDVDNDGSLASTSNYSTA